MASYLLAGINVAAHAQIKTFGVPFQIGRPDLLPAGLAITSLLSALRFYYYGLMLATGPYRRRRDLLDALIVDIEEYVQPDGSVSRQAYAGRQTVFMYWGPRRFITSPWLPDREDVERWVFGFQNAFPKFARARTSARVVNEPFTDDEGDQHVSFAAKIVIPRRCRVAALFEDLDYTSPVWLNLLGLCFYVWSLWRARIG